MEPVRLLERQDTIGAQAQFSRELQVLISDNADGVLTVRRGLIAQRTLTAVVDDEQEFDLVRQDCMHTWLTRDNPFLLPQHRDRLDERGLILPGAILKTGDVLASVLSAQMSTKHGRPRDGHIWARDDSWETPAAWDGTWVTSVRVLTKSELKTRAPSQVYQRVVIAVRAEHDLAIGDVLLKGQKSLGVIAALGDDAQLPRAPDGRPVDLVVPDFVGERLGAKPGAILPLPIARAKEPAARALQARSMEWYSVITKEPLLNSPEPGQIVRTAQIEWLQRHGLNANVGELTSLKSDDLAHRAVMQRLVQTGAPTAEAVPDPGAPESLLLLHHYLMSLGLVVTLETTGRAVSVAVRPAADADVLGWSAGPVHKPYTVESPSLDETEGGLFCTRVFGPREQARRLRWGHIPLPCPVVSPLWRLGKPSLLEKLLGLPGEAIERLLRGEQSVHFRGRKWEIGPLSKETDCLTGGSAVLAMLDVLDPHLLPPTLRGRAAALVSRVAPVMPADLRPLVLLSSGNFATHDVNDLYLVLVSRAARLAKLEELQAPDVIVGRERSQVQQAYDALIANSLLPPNRAVMAEGKADVRLVDCLGALAAHVRKDQKRVEWCGRARAVCLKQGNDRHVELPKPIFETLRLGGAAPVLVTSYASVDGAFVALLPRPHDDVVIALPRDAFNRLQLNRDCVPLAVVHRPLGTTACAEADRLFRDGATEGQAVHSKASWLDAAEIAEFASQLVGAALSGETVVLDSPRLRLLGGPGAVDFVDDADLPCAPVRVDEVGRPA